MSSLIRLNEVSVHYPIRGGIWGKTVGHVQAVNKVSLEVRPGEIVGLVGESGCGKSTLGKALLRLVPVTNGQIFYKDQEISRYNNREFRKFRKNIQMIFQDPFSSLNPRMKIGQILSEPFVIHKICPTNEIRQNVMELLKIVGLRPESYDKFPHEFSGGQRQRIGIARALAVKPDFIVADEPVSALDVSIQSQILNLLQDLRKRFNLTLLFVSHDLNVIRYLCDRVVVMYLGRVMEVLDRDQLTNSKVKLHPYTQALLSAAPRRHPAERREIHPITGDIPSPANPPKGCVFNTRCPEATERCKVQEPGLVSDQVFQHQVACHERQPSKS